MQNKRRAQNELYNELFSYLMNICIRYKTNYDDAGSALNAIYFKILKGLVAIDINKPFLPWVKTIAIRHLVDEYRQNKKYIPNEASINDLEFMVESTEMDVNQKLNAEDILNLIKQLPETTSQVFNLYVIDGYKHREISEMLEVSEGTSKWHLNMARKQLQAMLAAETKRLQNIKVEL